MTVGAVPVMTAGLERPVIGTGFLSRFLPTLDYPAGRLVLRPRDGRAAARHRACRSAIAATHLLVVRGSLDGRDDLTFVVDSGLEDEPGAAFTAPAATLAAAGIPLPETRRSGATPAPATSTSRSAASRSRDSRSGAGRSGTCRHLRGLPAAAGAAAGFPIHGLVSHGFLRRYRWTIDFTRMTMRFALPG